jgi:pyruvate dehydrogenase E2 component (dihydrolipoamide acetyltransferase)
VVEYRLPDLGEGMTEAELVRWLVKPGDRVVLDQPLAEMQTDKVLVELPAPAAGVVQALHVAEGQMVPVGTNLLTIEDSAASTAAPSRQTEGAASERSRPATAGTAEVVRQVAATSDSPPVRSGTTPANAAAAQPAWAPAPAEPDRRVLATPAVRRLAREHGIDLKAIRGSGLAGRVLATDLRAAIEGAPAPAPALEPAAEEAAPAGMPPLARPRPVGASQETAVVPPAGAVGGPAREGEAGPAEERLPLRGLRRRIAENMVLSVSTIPQVTSMVEIDASGLVALRRSVLPAAEAQNVKLSYLPFIVKALVQALRVHPYVNAAIDDATKEIVLKRVYHIGIATATPDGLLVPVLRHADRLTVLEVAAEIERLAEGGRARKLGMDELRGSTFTISNYGAVGGFFATPIINPGEAGILGLGRIVDRPWVVEGRVEVRPVLPLSFTADHRLIDGDLAMRFMNTLIALLEQPARLLLAMR